MVTSAPARRLQWRDPSWAPPFADNKNQFIGRYWMPLAVHAQTAIPTVFMAIYERNVTPSGQTPLSCAIAWGFRFLTITTIS